MAWALVLNITALNALARKEDAYVLAYFIRDTWFAFRFMLITFDYYILEPFYICLDLLIDLYYKRIFPLFYGFQYNEHQPISRWLYYISNATSANTIITPPTTVVSGTIEQACMALFGMAVIAMILCIGETRHCNKILTKRRRLQLLRYWNTTKRICRASICRVRVLIKRNDIANGNDNKFCYLNGAATLDVTRLICNLLDKIDVCNFMATCKTNRDYCGEYIKRKDLDPDHRLNGYWFLGIPPSRYRDWQWTKNLKSYLDEHNRIARQDSFEYGIKVKETPFPFLIKRLERARWLLTVRFYRLLRQFIFDSEYKLLSDDHVVCGTRFSYQQFPDDADVTIVGVILLANRNGLITYLPTGDMVREVSKAVVFSGYVNAHEGEYNESLSTISNLSTETIDFAPPTTPSIGSNTNVDIFNDIINRRIVVEFTLGLKASLLTDKTTAVDNRANTLRVQFPWPNFDMSIPTEVALFSPIIQFPGVMENLEDGKMKLLGLRKEKKKHRDKPLYVSGPYVTSDLRVFGRGYEYSLLYGYVIRNWETKETTLERFSVSLDNGRLWKYPSLLIK